MEAIEGTGRAAFRPLLTLIACLLAKLGDRHFEIPAYGLQSSPRQDVLEFTQREE